MVYDSSLHFLGFIGGIFAVLGVVVLPITSGDTAFRAARLQLAELFKIDQRSLAKRLMIAVPLFALGFVVSKIDFSILWRYFTWANQMTAMVMLWTAAAYLYRYKNSTGYVQFLHGLSQQYVQPTCSITNRLRFRLSTFCLLRFCNNCYLYRIVLHHA
ncbi:carbon starvation protein, membrane protein [Actinobacillus equuli]|nr:carbon starvation protein, membrane protein [Actinobacillus equuli]